MTKVFVVGVPRSGTTLLATILENHDEVFLEPKAIGPSFVEMLNNVYNIQFNNPNSDIHEIIYNAIIETPRVKRFLFDYFEKEYIRNNIYDIRELINEAVFKKLKKFSKTVWVDKCPPMIFDIPILSYYFPDAKFINVIRDGRAVSLSLNKRQYMNIYLAANYWKTGILLGKYYGSVLGPKNYMEIKYEDLIMNPEDTIKEVLTFLGLEYNENMIDLAQNPVTGEKNSYVKKDYDYTKIISWKNRLSRKTIYKIEKIEGNILKSCGYEMLVSKEKEFKNLGPSLYLFLKITDILKNIIRVKQISMVDRKLVETRLPFFLRLRKGFGNLLSLIFSEILLSIFSKKKRIFF